MCGGSVGSAIASIDPGPAIGSALASVDKTVNNTIPGGWGTIGAATLLAVGIADPSLLSLADSGQLTETALAEAGYDPATVTSAINDGTTVASTAPGSDVLASNNVVNSAVTSDVAGTDPTLTAFNNAVAANGVPAQANLSAQELIAAGYSPTSPEVLAAGGAPASSITSGSVPFGSTGGATIADTSAIPGAVTGATTNTSALSNMLPYALGASAATNLVGSVLGANASQKAAQIQSNAAQNASQLSANMFNVQNAQQAPYRAAGYNSLNQIGSMLPGNYMQYDASGNPVGVSQGTGYLTHQFNAQDLNANMSPGYAFQLQQGQNANLNAANALGGRVSGNALQGLQNYTQGLAQTNYQNAFNNYQTQRSNIYNTLAGIAGIGQTSQQQTGNLAQNAATTQAQLGVGSAAAQAAGNVGQAQAYSGGAQGLSNNLLLASLLGQNQSAAGA